jgi:hypothetical protein
MTDALRYGQLLLKIKKAQLIGLRESTERTGILQGFNNALADTCSCLEVLNGDELTVHILTSGKVKGRRLAQAAYGNKGRAKLLISYRQELGGIRLIEVNGRKLKAAHIELVHCLQSDKQILFVGGLIGLAAKKLKKSGLFFVITVGAILLEKLVCTLVINSYWISGMRGTAYSTEILFRIPQAVILFVAETVCVLLVKKYVLPAVRKNLEK